jgi:phosphoribosylanthranilate isomerase
MIRIKICGLTDPLNVVEIARTKPDFMGFIFYAGSPRYVGAEPDPELFGNVPQGIKKVGVFFNEENHRILEISQRTELDIIQLHGSESPEKCSALKSSGLTIIKAFSLDHDFPFRSLIKYLPACDYFLFDTRGERPGGNGRKFEWEMLKEYSLDKPFFLSGGIGHEDAIIFKTIENRGFSAVDINSRFETSPGIKDIALVKRFIKDIKTISYDL